MDKKNVGKLRQLEKELINSERPNLNVKLIVPNFRKLEIGAPVLNCGIENLRRYNCVSLNQATRCKKTCLSPNPLFWFKSI